MYLLHTYKDANIVVAHINYHKRKSADRDQKIVEEYCKKHNILLFVKDVPSLYEYNGNFQDIARKIRYSFFKQIYMSLNCTKLLTAHHLDDWLETAIMQKMSNRQPSYFGIKQSNTLMGMKVFRPFLFTHKKEQIIKELVELNIEYGIDETNSSDKYTRNKIRKNMMQSTKVEYDKLVDFFRIMNQLNEIKQENAQNDCNVWKQSQYDCDVFKSLFDKQSVVFKYVNHFFPGTKLSKTKMNSIIQFIESNNRTSKFKLNDKFYIIKKQNYLVSKNMEFKHRNIKDNRHNTK